MIIIIFFDILGCWQGIIGSPNQPRTGAAGIIRDCVVGNPARKGFWANIECTVTSAGVAVKRGSICEKDVPAPTTSNPTVPTPSSMSTYLQSGTTNMMGRLSILLLIRNL